MHVLFIAITDRYPLFIFRHAHFTVCSAFCRGCISCNTKNVLAQEGNLFHTSITLIQRCIVRKKHDKIVIEAVNIAKMAQRNTDVSPAASDKIRAVELNIT